MRFKTQKQRARIRIVQAIYQWLLTQADIADIERQYLANKKDKIAKTFFSELLRDIIINIEPIRAYIQPLLKHNIDEISQVDLAILYLGVYEIKFHKNLPVNIIINEAVTIAKDYGSQDSYKFINHLLDSLK